MIEHRPNRFEPDSSSIRCQRDRTPLTDMTEIRPSGALSFRGISAGNGLFAKRYIPVGTVLGYYHGNLLTADEAKLSTSNCIYALDDKPKWIPQQKWNEGYRCVDARLVSSNLKMINNGHNNPGSINIIVEGDGKMLTIRDVEEDEELFYDYGCSVEQFG